MSDKSLRSKVNRLAHQKPELREHLLPLVTKSAGSSFRKGDKVMLTLKGLQEYNKHRVPTKFSNEYSRELGAFYRKGVVGTITYDKPNNLSVSFNGTNYGVKEYMIEKV